LKSTSRRNTAFFAAALVAFLPVLLARHAYADIPLHRDVSLLTTHDLLLTSAPEDFAAEFDKVLQTVQDHFWDKQLGGVDWKKTGDTYRAKLKDVKTKSDFTALVNRMLEELHSSHTAYINDDDVEFYMLPAVMARDMEEHRVTHIGVMGKERGGAYIVSAVLDGGPAQKAGIHAGDMILTADGGPFTTSGSFRGKEGKQVELAVKRAGSTSTETVNVVPIKQNQLRAFLSATRASAHIMNVQGKRIGYVHLWTMANDNFKSALDNIMVNQLHDTDGLILDLRDGFGGIPFGYMDVFTRPDVAWESQYRGGEPNVSHTGYNKPMVVLINEGTRSAKEFLSYQFKSSHRALLVGKQTAGAFLGAGSFPISDSGLLEMAIVGLKVDGIKLEQDGVRPDVEVEPKDSYTEHDQQMKVAEDRLVQQLTKPAVAE